MRNIAHTHAHSNVGYFWLQRVLLARLCTQYVLAAPIFFWLLCMQRAQQAQKTENTKQTDAILPLIPTTLWPGHQANFPLSGDTLSILGYLGKLFN